MTYIYGAPAELHAMSFDPTLPILAPPPPSDLPAADQSAPPASLKPLLNPLQTDSPALSTIVEPPRSPNRENAATDHAGNNVELSLPSASNSVVGPGETIGEEQPSVSATSGVALNGSVTDIYSPLPPIDSSAVAPVSKEDTAPPPLPTDAPIPPTPPQPLDEPQPTLPDGAIPPAVSTPTVITTETPAAPQPTPAIQTAPVPSSIPNGVAAPTIPAAASRLDEAIDQAPISAPAHAAQQPMEIDPPAHSSPAGLDSRASEVSLKRAGDDDLEGRDEKRVREDAMAALPPNASVQSPAPTAYAAPVESKPAANASAPVIPGLILDPNAPPPPWITYVEPPARPSGPTTPLTPTQHKHLLAALRSLKKNKDAGFFLSPVDVVQYGIPHYAQIITRPMDLTTVELKLIVSDPRGPPKDKSKLKGWDESKGKYENVSQVVEDIRQIWENTRKFNGPNHVVTLAAAKLEDAFEKGFRNMPSEPVASLPPPPSPAAPSVASPAGPSTHHVRRQSISQAPPARRSSDGPDSSRPKREIHPPPSKDLGYTDGTARKPKRRNDPQLQWTLKTLKSFETTQKHHAIVSPFLYPVEDIMAAIPVYADLIKKPIDLLKIKKRLEDGEYEDFPQVDGDIRLMVRNAQTFNPPTDPVYEFATALLQLWTEKIRNLPPKQELRDASEDPLADDFIEEGSDEEDANQLYRLEEQLTTIQAQIADIRARRAQRKSRLAKKVKKGARKQSISKGSPGLGSNGHGQLKKGRKSKDVSYRDDDDADSDDESGGITRAQKQELADKMTNTDAETLNKAILIIQQTTDLGSNNEDIELDIDSLPARTVLKLYNLVVRGGRKAPKNKNAPLKKTGRKATGGANRKYMNEEEEADRIRRMEQQLQNYDAGRSGQPGGRAEFGYDGEGDDSSEEESSDED